MSRINDEYHNKLQRAADQCKADGLGFKDAADKLKKDYRKSNHKQRRGVLRHAYGLTKNSKAA